MIKTGSNIFACLILSLVIIPVTSVAATVDVFTNRTSWLAATNTAITNATIVDDDMEGELQPDLLRQSITLDGSNITFKTSVGAVDEVDDFLFVQSSSEVLTDDGTGAYFASSVPGGMRSLALRISHYPTTDPIEGFYNSAQEFTVDLPEATKSLSFDFAGIGWINPEGNSGLRISILDQLFIPFGRFEACCEGFFGAVSDTAFSTFKFTYPGHGNYDKFEIGRISYASEPSVEISPVPLPASLPLLALGMLCIGLIKTGCRATIRT